ncbi:MAG: hypothetical protein K9M54_12500 [Kiritimatiellales bacterium]|nr:hypothetical protein [Kiritimatiellales bacterium]
MNRYNRRGFLVFAGSVLPAASTFADEFNQRPKGILLNLDFQHIADGLIPNKTLYPLYVPLGGLDAELVENRYVLAVQTGQHLDIPHSSLLDPDGSEWIAMIRVFARTDGIIMSQANDEKGYVIYIQDGQIRAAVRTGHSAVVLAENNETGTSCLNKWITVELRIKPDMATLNLNRALVALAPLQAALMGGDYFIRIGEHNMLPAPLEHNPTATPSGFSGAIGSFKILRQ